jgi:hypothetical protein
MALPKIVVRDRVIVILSGYDKKHEGRDSSSPVIIIRDEQKLRQSAQRDPDAVAFGYVAGKWVSAA